MGQLNRNIPSPSRRTRNGEAATKPCRHCAACLCSGRPLLGGQLLVSLTDEIDLLSTFCPEKFSDAPRRQRHPKSQTRSDCTVPSATRPLDIVSFLLTPQVHRRKIPATFPFLFWSREPERKRSRVNKQGGETCSICRDGPCSVSIRSAWLVATGCVPPPPEENFAATAMRHSTMFRRR
jgi:hypothetical protein